MILICNCEPCCMHSRSKEKCYFILYLFCNRESCCINSRSIRARRCTDGKIQRLLVQPPNSKFIINMFYFWTKGSKNFQNFFIPNFEIVYIYVFSAPRTLIAIFCLFICFLLVIRSHTGIGLADWGACMGPFFSVVMFCWVRAHTCICPRLKKRIRRTQ